MKKTVVITGATSGIGLAAARFFAAKGYNVYGIARREYGGDDFTCYRADVRDGERIKEILGEVYAQSGGIDVLVNNAGMGIAGAVEDATKESIQNIVDINFTALCGICSAAIPYMREGGGKIINVSSVGGIVPLPYQAMYSATKAGVEVFSRALDSELRPKKIRVSAVLPGDTKTGFTSARVCEGENERAKKSVAKMARDEQRGKSPETVAKVIYKVSKRKNPPLSVAVGFVSKLEVFLVKILPKRFVNFIVRKLYG